MQKKLHKHLDKQGQIFKTRTVSTSFPHYLSFENRSFETHLSLHVIKLIYSSRHVSSVFDLLLTRSSHASNDFNNGLHEADFVQDSLIASAGSSGSSSSSSSSSSPPPSAEASSSSSGSGSPFDSICSSATDSFSSA